MATRVPKVSQEFSTGVAENTYPFNRWLVSHNRPDEAVQIIADLEDKDTNDSFVQLQMSEIKYTVEYERANGVSFMDLLRGKANDKAGTKTVRRILLGITCQSYQQYANISRLISGWMLIVFVGSVASMSPVTIYPPCSKHLLDFQIP